MRSLPGVGHRVHRLIALFQNSTPTLQGLCGVSNRYSNDRALYLAPFILSISAPGIDCRKAPTEGPGRWLDCLCSAAEGDHRERSLTSLRAGLLRPLP